MKKEESRQKKVDRRMKNEERRTIPLTRNATPSPGYIPKENCTLLALETKAGEDDWYYVVNPLV